jgi:predicted phosphodiesterase
MAKISILSDAHLLIQAEHLRDESTRSQSGEISLENFDRVMSQILSEKPEAVILAGDMFDERERGGAWVADVEAAKYWPDIRSGLKQLLQCTKYGIYALRGNHDSGPVLRELQDSLGSGFHFVRNEEEKIGQHRVYFMETRYRQGSYRVPEEELPTKGEILIMHETLPLGMPGLEEEVLEELSKRFSLLLNGHMHFYAHGLLGIPNLYSLPALIPSRELKNNYTVEYRWPGDLEKPKVRESPFGYLVLDDDGISFKRYTPVQSIVNVRVEGENPGDVITGIREVYSRLMEREDRGKLWVWVSVKGVTFEHVVREETNRYQEIHTMDISVEVRGEPLKPVQLRGLDKVMSLSELETRVLTSLSGADKDLAQKLFEEVFNDDNLSGRADSNIGRILFQRVIQLAALHYGVPEQNLDSFLLRVDPLWKKR